MLPWPGKLRPERADGATTWFSAAALHPNSSSSSFSLPPFLVLPLRPPPISAPPLPLTLALAFPFFLFFSFLFLFFLLSHLSLTPPPPSVQHGQCRHLKAALCPGGVPKAAPPHTAKVAGSNTGSSGKELGAPSLSVSLLLGALRRNWEETCPDAATASSGRSR